MLTDGLVEFWTLNATLVGINGNTLVSPDGLDHYVPGKIGQGWNVGANAQQVLYSAFSPINPGSSNWSMSFWWLVVQNTDPWDYYVFRATDGTSSRLRVLLASTDGPTLTVSIYASWGGLDFEDVAVLSQGWHLFTVTRAADHLVFYLDGEAKNESTEAADFSLWANPRLYLGGGSTPPLASVLDAVGWWARALSPTEIAELYNSGLGWEPSVSSIVTNILHGSTPETSRILRSRIVPGIV